MLVRELWQMSFKPYPVFNLTMSNRVVNTIACIALAYLMRRTVPEQRTRAGGGR